MSEDEPGAHPGSTHNGRRNRRVLLLLLLLSCGLRIAPALWGSKLWNAQQYAFHTDEPKLVRFVDEFPGSLQTFHDYRYPTLVPIALGATWTAVGGLGTREEGKSLPGNDEYEAALVFGRVLLALLAAIAGGLCIWGAARRMFGEEAALWALAATSLMGRPVVSAALVQIDIPAAWLMAAALLAALRWNARGGLDLKGAVWCGVLTGLAAGAKYTAIVAGIPVACVVFAAWHAKTVTLGVALGRTIVVGVACLVALLLSVPGILYDWAAFQDSIAYEYTRKIVTSEFTWSSVWDSVAENFPWWLLGLALVGVVQAARATTVKCIHVGVALSAGLFLATSLRSFKPDYALFLYPLVGIYAGAGIAAIRGWSPVWMGPALLLGVLVGHGHSAYVVAQRYHGDTHYRFEEWVTENLEPQELGLAPRTLRADPHSPKPVRGYPWTSAHDEPEWVVAPERCYWYAQRFFEDADWFKERMDTPAKFSVEPGKRRLAGLRERDFRWYEDVLLGMGRHFTYDLVHTLEPVSGPFDDAGLEIRIYRKR